MKTDYTKQFISLHKALLDEKTQLEARLEEINAALAVTAPGLALATGSSAPAPKAARVAAAPKTGRRGRGQNSISLKSAVKQVLAQGSKTKGEILDAVQSLGYKFSGKDPANSLGTVLYSDKVTFVNTGGQFSLAPGVSVDEEVAEVTAAPKKAAAKKVGRGKRTLSPEAKARIAEGQRKRWAAQKAKKA